MSILSERPRWSGFHSQSLAWQRGYEWAHDRGPYHALGMIEAAEAWGYDFNEDFDKGAEFAQQEQSGG